MYLIKVVQEEIVEVKCHKDLLKVCQVSLKKFTSSIKTVNKIKVFVLLPQISRDTPPIFSKQKSSTTASQSNLMS